MADLSAFQLIWIGSASIVVLGWLICAFSAPSPGRTIVEWLSATSMYVGLVTLFISLVIKADASGNMFALVAFGFLCVLFGGGFVVSLWHTLASFGRASQTGTSATN